MYSKGVVLSVHLAMSSPAELAVNLESLTKEGVTKRVRTGSARTQGLSMVLMGSAAIVLCVSHWEMLLLSCY
jgi:hypothetical protein